MVVTTTCIVRFVGILDIHVYIWLLCYSTHIDCNSMELKHNSEWEGDVLISIISTVI